MEGPAVFLKEIRRLQALIPARAPKMARRADGIHLIERERAEQVSREGWTPEHDDHHADGSLAMAAAVYAATAAEQAKGENGPFASDPSMWPWEPEDYKPKDQVRNLVRAGALIAAEIDRLMRAKAGEVSEERQHG